MYRFAWIFLVCLLAACSTPPSRPPLEPTPTPLHFTALVDIMQSALPASGQGVTTAGYVYVDAAGARLLDGISPSADTTPQPLTAPADQIWIAENLSEQHQTLLRNVGSARLAIVLARGQLTGPGAYGPDGQHRFYLRNPQFQPIVPQETTIAMLANPATGATDRFVRIDGALLVSASSAVLVERMHPGGAPDSTALQIKLHTPIRDVALLQRLATTPGGNVQYGVVQIEGFWRQGVLHPLAITPIT